MSSPAEQRRKLEGEIKNAWAEYNRATAERQKLEIELSRARRQFDAAVKARPMGRATDHEVEFAEQRVQELADAYQQHHGRECAALDAAKALEYDLDVLLAEHVAEYAEDAEAATQQAVAQLRELQDALGQAWEAWQAAEAAWAPLTRVMRAQGVPPCPLPDPAEILSLVPRPPQVEVA